MILKTVEQVRRIFRIVAGFTLLAAGVVMLVTPGPGWVVILLGLGLLAAEFVWARRLMDRIKREGNRIKDTVLGKPEAPRQVIESAIDAFGAVDALVVNHARSSGQSLQTATAEELDKLPGVGPARAKAIIANRPYGGKDYLNNRKIIPPNVYNQIKDKIIARQK